MIPRKNMGGVGFRMAEPRAPQRPRPDVWGALAWCILAPAAFLAGWFLAASGILPAPF